MTFRPLFENKNGSKIVSAETVTTKTYIKVYLHNQTDGGKLYVRHDTQK
jgi:hypothetical protein